MDWFQVLVVVLLVVLPLIQQVLGRRGEPPAPPPDPERMHAEAEAGGGTGVLRAPETGAPEEEDAGWAAGWGGWPVEVREVDEAEAIAAEGVAAEEAAGRLAEIQERLAAEYLPEAVRVSAPVVSMERLHVDRAAEHRRFHAGLEATAGVRRAPRAPRLAALLRSRDELRRAVILAEVVGPPRGLR